MLQNSIKNCLESLQNKSGKHQRRKAIVGMHIDRLAQPWKAAVQEQQTPLVRITKVAESKNVSTIVSRNCMLTVE